MAVSNELKTLFLEWSEYVMNGLKYLVFKNWPLQIGYAALLVSLLVMGRAYATDNIGFPLRLAMWSIIVGLIVVQTRIIFGFIQPRLPLPVVAEAVTLTLTSFLCAAELALLKYTPLLPKSHDPYFEFVLFLIAPVFILGGGALLLDRFVSSQQNHSKNIAANRPASEILTVQAQEHYILLTTAEGTKIRRGKFREQVAQLKGLDGIQVHRSWWVARAAVSSVTKQERDYVIQLVSGECVPVARSKVALLREMGWI
ncbi:LytTR family DNA-binding domain-containing protein [Arenicella xantha]|uniref:LytTr DNA-binding domain-containing protein n=1 Tax=Arenicella xantha TaxID=644221 RepID=A0A395JQ77_9GAMM|nr:LytTR family DNA-binding domain-containing protein [Arenicella xantha]RBP51728.1 LytTr DNA-binding domain-containing protein [Arenicella xantha]